MTTVGCSHSLYQQALRGPEVPLCSRFHLFLPPQAWGMAADKADGHAAIKPQASGKVGSVLSVILFLCCLSRYRVGDRDAPCPMCSSHLLSRVRLFATPWTTGHQAPLSMGFPREEYWSGLPFPSPGDLPNPEIKPSSPALAGRVFTTEPPGKPPCIHVACIY